MTEPKVDDLWRWYKPVSIGSRQIWMRTLSATDDGERTKVAMKASLRLRAKLLRDGSPERNDLLETYQGISRDEILAAIREFYLQDARAQVGNEVHATKDPPEPEGPTLDDTMDAEQVWQDELTDLEQRRKDWVKNHVETLMDKREPEDDDTLRVQAVDMQISAFCQREYAEEFTRQSIFRACYDDKKFTKRTFASAENVGEMDRFVYQKLVNEYFALDQYSMNADHLKN